MRVLAPLLSLLIALVLAFLPGGHAVFSDVIGRHLVTFLRNDYYGALGLEKTATLSEIKSAYRKLSRTYHPDRNPDADPQRFLDIAAANEVLSSPEMKEKYDLFLYECPARFRPIYGSQRNDSALALGFCAFLATVVLISIAQDQQYKRERHRAINSKFYHDALEAAKENGQTEEEFEAMFIRANPEMKRTWKDTVGARLLYFPVRVVRGSPKPIDVNKEDDASQSQEKRENTTVTDGGAHNSLSQEEEEEFVPLPIPDGTPPEEVKAIEKRNRKRLKLFNEKKQAAAQKKAKETKRQAAAARREQQREAQNAKLEQERARVARMEEERLHKVVLERRKSQIQKEVDKTILVRLLEDGDDSLGVYFRNKGLISASGGDVEQRFAQLRDELLSLVGSDALDAQEFWANVFDLTMAQVEDEKRELAQAEQEAYEAEQRRKIMILNGEISDDDVGQKTSSEISLEDKPLENDEEWGKELAAKEAAKQAKKELAKQERLKKSAANKLANEQAKATAGTKQNKERRR